MNPKNLEKHEGETIPQENHSTAVSHKDVPGMFDGPLGPLLIRLALPMMMGMLFNIAYTIVDTYFISSIDPSDPSIIGGSGLIFPVVFLFVAMANGLMIGVSSLVARAIGERDNGVLSRVADSGVALALVLGVLSVLLGYIFSDGIVSAMGAQGDYARHALDYFQWILPGLGAMLTMQVLIGVIQGEGQVKYMMRAMILGNLVNIFLDPFFILERVAFLPGLNMGVRGAALATVLGQSLAAVYLIWVFAAKKTRVPVAWSPKHVRLHLIEKILSVGFPQTLAQIMMSVTFLVLNRIMIGIDPRTVTAASLCGRMDQIVLIPIFALSSALMTVVGQNMGRGLMERARKSWRIGALIAIASVTVTATMMVLLAPLVYSIFTSDATVLRYSVLQTYILEYSFLFAAVAITARAVFQANGRPWPALVITGLRMLGFVLPFVYIFTSLFHWGIYGVWGGIIAGNLIVAVLAVTWTEGYWKKLLSGQAVYQRTGGESSCAVEENIGASQESVVMAQE
ncbi:MAG: MATE family efflux transporter [Spirochaetales bacterium]|nr:MATE family efflux transporter [Spirochaetales bacterium]